MIKLSSFLTGGLIFLSCVPAPVIEVQKDPFSGRIIYYLENNILDENYPSIDLEFNIQKTISKNYSEYHILLEILNTSAQFLEDSVSVSLIIDEKKLALNPVQSLEELRLDSELNLETLILPISLQTLKWIGYGVNVSMKIEGNRNFIKAQFSLKNKINIQKFIESIVPLEEQISSNP